MLNQLLRFTLVSSALLWLRPRWRGLLALAAFVGLVHVLHGEYLHYVQLSGEQSLLLWSYGIKWLALVIALSVYVFFALPRGGARARDRARPERQAREPEPALPADDGFDFLRRKKRLEGRAEKVLSKKSR
ncbi:MAG: hypothetical protein U5K56_19575 [Halioglobus sp.]|nr:hypothetical protein [Halioglobus sp.]